MFGWIVLLFFIGISLLSAELFLPGFGVFGVLGIISFCVAILITANTYGILYMCFSIIILIIIMLIIFYIIKKNKVYSKVILTETLNKDESLNKNNLEYLQKFIGKKGIAITPLKPFGKADFDGEIIEVYSYRGYIIEGKYIEVINIDNNNIIVKEINY